MSGTFDKPLKQYLNPLRATRLRKRPRFVALCLTFLEADNVIQIQRKSKLPGLYFFI